MVALVTSHVNMSHCQKQKSVSVLNRGGQLGLHHDLQRVQPICLRYTSKFPEFPEHQ